MTTETSTTHAEVRTLSYAWHFPFTQIIRGWFIGSGGVNKNSFIRLDWWINITSFNNPKTITRTSSWHVFTRLIVTSLEKQKKSEVVIRKEMSVQYS
ncbi:hypothetical protein HID58_084744 [Brassica napus]|uniref:K Homology domain-containing protein n=1 Tax=Brassica napus TaxID=3708 RepID=A0ABQ7XN29_BRANA|nr:hypothetical protein HID58_084744 [Brassica napus]